MKRAGTRKELESLRTAASFVLKVGLKDKAPNSKNWNIFEGVPRF